MSEQKQHPVLLWQMSLIFFAAGIMFYNLIPFSLTPATLPMPDVLFCVICALIIRRPNIVPFGLIALIFFSFDIFLTKPPGVWTICILISSEVLRRNRDAFMENLFPFEWLYFSLVFCIAFVINLTLLTVSFAPTPTASSVAWEFVFTVMSYPIVIFVITYIFRIKKPTLGAFSVKDHKI